MIPESFIEEVLSRTDIVQVIGRYVKLQHKGFPHGYRAGDRTLCEVAAQRQQLDGLLSVS